MLWSVCEAKKEKVRWTLLLSEEAGSLRKSETDRVAEEGGEGHFNRFSGLFRDLKAGNRGSWPSGNDLESFFNFFMQRNSVTGNPARRPSSCGGFAEGGHFGRGQKSGRLPRSICKCTMLSDWARVIPANNSIVCVYWRCTQPKETEYIAKRDLMQGVCIGAVGSRSGMTRAHSLNMVNLQMERGNLPDFCPRPKCPPSANPPNEEGRLAGFSLSRV